MNQHERTLKRLGLDRMEIPANQHDAIESRVRPRLNFLLDSPYLLINIQEKVEALAFDCYTQGLLDGALKSPQG